MEISTLTNQHLQEKGELEKLQKFELKQLEDIHLKERSQNRATNLKILLSKQEQELGQLKSKHSFENQRVFEKQEGEYAELIKLKEINKSTVNYEIENDRIETMLKRREEAANMKAEQDAEIERRKSLIEKFNDQWSKSQEKDRGK